MTIAEPAVQSARRRQKLTGAIFDVDGVLLASPHERAWREALKGYADPAHFTPGIYEDHVAGKPRLSGAQAALEALGVRDAAAQAPVYAERKQKRLEELIEGVRLRLSRRLAICSSGRGAGWPMAVASSSKNANAMMKRVRLASRRKPLRCLQRQCLWPRFAARQTRPRNFPARRQGAEDRTRHICFVAEDAPAGMEAAHAGGMTALGVARKGDAAVLWNAGADVVVTSLDEVEIDELAAGHSPGG